LCPLYKIVCDESQGKNEGGVSMRERRSREEARAARKNIVV
jgi:hypothetical protein